MTQVMTQAMTQVMDTGEHSPYRKILFVNSRIDILSPRRGVVDGFLSFTKKLKCFSTIHPFDRFIPHDYSTTTKTMFASLKTGDLATSYFKLPGLYTEKDEIRHTLTTYTVAMRHNIAEGNPIFAGIRKPEEEIEKNVADASEVFAATENTEDDTPLPHHDEELMTPHTHRCRYVSVTSEDDPNYKIERDNVALAEIFAKELAFLNRTIQMISLVASRYLEEQEDAAWDYSGDIETGDDNVGSNDYDYDEDEDEDEDEDFDCVITDGSAAPLTRSQSHSHDDVRSADYNDHRPKNHLANTLLIGSGHLQQQFLSLCSLAETDITLVNAMTTTDRPITEASLTRKQTALKLVISSLYFKFGDYDAYNRNHVVRVFQTLRDISSAAWAMMSLLAFSNLFRLTHGTDFELAPINPDDAIFSNQGRPFRPRMGTPAATMPEEMRIRCDSEEVMTTTTDQEISSM